MSIGGPDAEPPAEAGAAFDAFEATREVHDTPAEVDAAFRTLRRVAGTYFAIFLLVIVSFPVLTMTLQWWTASRVVGDLSPAFVTAAAGLYLFFAVLGVVTSLRSSAVESRMLGGTGHDPDATSPAGPAERRDDEVAG